MDYTVMTQIVSTLGFPIVMCGVLVWLNVKQMNARAESEENFTNALADNTKAYIELKDAISNLKVKGEN
nr:MAG TPA: YvrJ protein family protein [Caudoviricetes sp.]